MTKRTSFGHGPRRSYISKIYITWDNEVDAYRHNIWNSMMAKEIGYKEARIVANNHELLALKEYDLVISEKGNTITTYLYQAYVMDLHNNAVGRNLISNPDTKNKSYDQMVEYALDESLIITDASKTYEYFNVQAYADSLNRIKVQWNTENNSLKVWNSDTNKYDYTINLG